jgi:hypothetical protein
MGAGCAAGGATARLGGSAGAGAMVCKEASTARGVMAGGVEAAGAETPGGGDGGMPVAPTGGGRAAAAGMAGASTTALRNATSRAMARSCWARNF